MLRARVLYKWFQVVLCGALGGVCLYFVGCTAAVPSIPPTSASDKASYSSTTSSVEAQPAVRALTQDTRAVNAQPTAHANMRLMFMFQGSGQEGSQTVENALTQAFQGYGFSVIDAATVAQTVRRNADLLQRYDVEAAKRLGVRLGADIVISGTTKTRVVDKTSDTLGGKRYTVSQADISAKAIMVRSGKILTAKNTHRNKPFDNTGERALQEAAEAMADELRQGIEQALSRDTVDYHLFLSNVSPQQSAALQEGMRQRVPGVRQVSDQGVVQNTLELMVNVERQQDGAFKGNLPAQLASLGLGRFEMVAREEEAIYLRRVGNANSGAGRVEPGESKPRPPSPPLTPVLPSSQKPRSSVPTDEAPSANGAPQSPTYHAGYGKSWAVVIGINAYQKWPKLEYAVNDAKSVGDVLRKLGFDEVIMLLDGEATQQNILRILGDDLKAKTQDEDRVFIFFAGHGQTEDIANGKMGYIIPVEGERDNYYSTAISMHQLQDLTDRLRAKHIFYALDSCFSGLLRLRGISDKTDCPTCYRARQFLTAGSEGEQVAEVEGHGLFTKVLIAGLQGAAVHNQDR